MIYAERGPGEMDVGRAPPVMEPGRGLRDIDMGGGPHVIYGGRGPGEIDAGRGFYPPPPKIARYQNPPGDVAEVIAQRGNRPAAPRLALSSQKPPPPAGRRTPTTVGLGPPPATQPASQPQPKTVEAKAVEGKPIEGRTGEGKSAEAKAAEGPPPEQGQHPKQMYGMKVLPASCWSGGASRWRWWGLDREATCKQ